MVCSSPVRSLVGRGLRRAAFHRSMICSAWRISAGCRRPATLSRERRRAGFAVARGDAVPDVGFEVAALLLRARFLRAAEQRLRARDTRPPPRASELRRRRLHRRAAAPTRRRRADRRVARDGNTVDGAAVAAVVAAATGDGAATAGGDVGEADTRGRRRGAAVASTTGRRRPGLDRNRCRHAGSRCRRREGRDRDVASGRACEVPGACVARARSCLGSEQPARGRPRPRRRTSRAVSVPRRRRSRRARWQRPGGQPRSVFAGSQRGRSRRQPRARSRPACSQSARSSRRATGRRVAQPGALAAAPTPPTASGEDGRGRRATNAPTAITHSAAAGPRRRAGSSAERPAPRRAGATRRGRHAASWRCPSGGPPPARRDARSRWVARRAQGNRLPDRPGGVVGATISRRHSAMLCGRSRSLSCSAWSIAAAAALL